MNKTSHFDDSFINKSSLLDSVERYNPNTNTWAMVTELEEFEDVWIRQRIVPKTVLPSTRPVEAMAAIICKPLPQVRSTTLRLGVMQAGMDIATKVGSKTQSYTSWDCASWSFVASFYYSGVGVEQGRPRRALVGEGEDLPEPDFPTEAEKKGWEDTDIDMFEDGKKVFYRAVGLLTRKQLATTRVQRLILGNDAHERVRRVQQQPPVHYHQLPKQGQQSQEAHQQQRH